MNGRALTDLGSLTFGTAASLPTASGLPEAGRFVAERAFALRTAARAAGVAQQAPLRGALGLGARHGPQPGRRAGAVAGTASNSRGHRDREVS